MNQFFVYLRDHLLLDRNVDTPIIKPFIQSCNGGLIRRIRGWGSFGRTAGQIRHATDERNPMSGAIEIGPNVIQFEDEFILVRILSFTPGTGMAVLLVEEKQTRIGFYYIFVHFKSGDNTRIDYDGANPNRPTSFTVQTSRRDDVIASIEAKKVR